MPDQYCDICDFIGPRELEGDTMAAFVELHRAWHAFGRDLARAFDTPAMRRVALFLTGSELAPQKSDFTLLNEPKGKP